MRYHQFLDTGELGGGNLWAMTVAERLRDAGCDTTVWAGGSGPAPISRSR